VRATVAGKSELVPARTVFRDDGTFTLTEHLPGSDGGNPRRGTWTQQPDGTFRMLVDGEGMGQTARLQGGKLYSSGGSVWSRR